MRAHTHTNTRLNTHKYTYTNPHTKAGISHACFELHMSRHSHAAKALCLAHCQERSTRLDVLAWVPHLCP